MATLVPVAACPCGSDLNFGDCCAPRLDGRTPAATAEQLMRSRYSAYVLQREDYLLATWHRTTRIAALDLARVTPAQWPGLKVLRVEAGTATDQAGVVEFVARYKVQGRAARLHESANAPSVARGPRLDPIGETSRFVHEDGRWFYVDGVVAAC
jgi:SEC-C motif-containing protein